MRDLLPYFERELALLGEQAQDFAKAYPRIAGRLSTSGNLLEDPHVERLVQSFHYALRAGGFLLLGTSERLARNAHLFTELDKKQRLYVRREDAHTHPRDFPSAQRRPAGHALPSPQAPSPQVDDLIDQQARHILEPWSPAYVVVNASHEVVRFGGDTRRYLAPSAGAAVRHSSPPSVPMTVSRARSSVTTASGSWTWSRGNETRCRR